MDYTRARVDEDIALDSSRLRSSARLGFAASNAATAATAVVTSCTTTSTTSSTAATTCRVVRRKRKKRRLQRPATTNDDAPGVAVANRPSGDTAVTEDTAAEGTAAGDVVVLEPDADATAASTTASAATAGTDSAAAQVDKPRSRLLVEQHTTGSGKAQLRVGGSGARAAASSVGTAGVTLLNRRAGKRSPRRCNAAGGRRSAMTMDLQRLINEVRARPAIWDQKNVNYHNRDVILKMWREIARSCEVSSEYDALLPACFSSLPHVHTHNVYLYARTCACDGQIASSIGWSPVGWVGCAGYESIGRCIRRFCTTPRGRSRYKFELCGMRAAQISEEDRRNRTRETRR